MADQVKYTAKLRDTKTLIIGGTSGIGYAVAEAVVEYGGRAIISSSNPTRVRDALAALKQAYPSAEQRIGGDVCDLSDETTIEQNIVRLLDAAGPLDHIVYTAGNSIPPTAIADATLETIRNAGTVRYTGAVFVGKHAPKYLHKSYTSSITFTSGVVTQRPIPNWSVIAGPRLAVVGLSKNLALDLKPIRVNVVALGAVDTPTWSHLSPDQREKTMSFLMSKSTTGRIAQASDVAEAYLYCMKDTNVSGSVITSDGGSLLN